MKRLALLIALVAGCSQKPCAVTSECGDGESCVAAHCAALSCSDTWYAVDPTTGLCTPLSGCVDHNSVANWQPCSDPCSGLSESDCKLQPSCQATYTSSSNNTPVACPADGDCSSPALATTFRSCHAEPQLVDPCKSLDATSCQKDSRCELAGGGSGGNGGGSGGCGCSSDGEGGGDTCNCPAQPACQLKFCGELTSSDACNARPDCTTSQTIVHPTPEAGVGGTTPPTSSGSTSSGSTQPASEPATSCFGLGGCFGADERDCLDQHACRAIYTTSGKYSSCDVQDFSRHCSSVADCNSGERCNSSGICVVAGCAGENEAECNADLHCEPIYALQCSPYANNGGGGVNDQGCGGTSGGSNGAPIPDKEPAPPIGGCSCEPSFSVCQPSGSGCDPGKSVMVRDPAILDDPFWALPRVLGLVSGADANLVADGWLAQLGTTATVGGQTSTARSGAGAFVASLPRRADGTLDASQLGFVPTSLSNRLDLADSTSCGEARITYALGVGVTDRRHRMTVIIELRQPYDGNNCRTIAQSWIGLTQLDGAALQAALQAIYTPLLTPANLKQVRTNEFLVGPQDPTQPTAAWELREFHLGADARLHQSLLPLQVDPVAVASSSDFLTWAQSNSNGLKRGTVTFPAQYQIPNGSEDGTTVSLSDGVVSNLVNAATCAGCHTTATNSAFAHVAERYQGSGRAEISQFLEGELQKRARHLGLVASGAANAVLDVRPMH